MGWDGTKVSEFDMADVGTSRLVGLWDLFIVDVVGGICIDGLLEAAKPSVTYAIGEVEV